jgi:DHA3 family macrolide efflux protein-like MFS transporter
MIDPKAWKRNATIFLATQALSLLGSSLVQYALMWNVTLSTKSGIMMTLFIICGFVPTFLLSPFAGVFADRFDRRKIIMLSDGLIALVTLALALALSLAGGRHTLWLMFLAAAIRSLGSALQGPAVGAFLPQLVPVDKLTRVSGINGSMQSVIMLVSPMLSGALLSLAPLQTVFFIDVGTAAIAIGSLALFLPVPPHEKALRKQEVSYLEDMRLGFRYIRGHRYLLSFFAYLSLFLFFVTPAAFLTPLQVTRSFGADVWRLTAIEIAFSAGMMAGGGLIAAWGGFKNRVRTMLLSNLVMALCTIALGLIPIFWLYLVFMGLFGAAMPFFNTPSAVMLQEQVETSYLGRVFSVMTMLSTSLMPMGMLIFGPLAELVPIERLLLGSGAVLLAMAIGLPFNRRLIEAGKKPVA